MQLFFLSFLFLSISISAVSYRLDMFCRLRYLALDVSLFVLCNPVPQTAGGAIGGILPNLEQAGMARPNPHSYRETIILRAVSGRIWPKYNEVNDLVEVKLK
jgi:hypothetical protein